MNLNLILSVYPSTISSEAVALEGYSLERCDRENRRGGGVGLYISKDCRYNVIHSQSFFESNKRCFEILVVEIFVDNSNLAVGVLYLPPLCDVSILKDTISSYALRLDEFILMGDFNCDLLDPISSRNLALVCHRNNLFAIHNNRHTYFDTFHGSSSLLDFFLASRNDKIVSSNQFLVPPSISKHCLIAIQYLFHSEV